VPIGASWSNPAIKTKTARYFLFFIGKIHAYDAGLSSSFARLCHARWIGVPCVYSFWFNSKSLYILAGRY
jgi:hypothetical protein